MFFGLNLAILGVSFHHLDTGSIYQYDNLPEKWGTRYKSNFQFLSFVLEYLFKWAPFLASTFPSLDLTLTSKKQKEREKEVQVPVEVEEDEEEEMDLMEQLCSPKQLVSHKGSQPIINIIKVRLCTNLPYILQLL